MTWCLVILEAVLFLLFPLVLGVAIDGMLQQDLWSLGLLGGLGGTVVFAGAMRRFYDTRVYSKLYTNLSKDIVTFEHGREANVSVIAARTQMATELVEFLENSLPEIIQSVIGFGGALLMIYFLQVDSFFACLAATGMILAIYAATSRHTLQLNKGANDESERRIDVIQQNDAKEVSRHFQRLMRWNIRLSDLETLTFSLSWFAMIAVLLFSVWATVHSGVTSHGKVLAILMYVFGYIESVTVLPFFYQQSIRLKEISMRLTR